MSIVEIQSFQRKWNAGLACTGFNPLGEPIDDTTSRNWFAHVVSWSLSLQDYVREPRFTDAIAILNSLNGQPNFECTPANLRARLITDDSHQIGNVVEGTMSLASNAPTADEREGTALLICVIMGALRGGHSGFGTHPVGWFGVTSERMNRAVSDCTRLVQSMNSQIVLHLLPVENGFLSPAPHQHDPPLVTIHALLASMPNLLQRPLACVWTVYGVFADDTGRALSVETLTTLVQSLTVAGVPDINPQVLATHRYYVDGRSRNVLAANRNILEVGNATNNHVILGRVRSGVECLRNIV